MVGASALASVLFAPSAHAQLLLNEANAVGVAADTYIQNGLVYEGFDYGTLVPYSGNSNPPITGTPPGNPFPADVDSGTPGNQTTLPNGWNGSTGWARIKFNGGDWWELVVTEDHTDLRGYTLYWENDDDGNSMVGEDGDDRSMVRLTNDRSFANLRAGTIITMSEDSSVDEIRDPFPEGPPQLADNDTGHDYDLSTNTGFNPFDGVGDWNKHYHVDESLTDVGTATQYFEGFSNIKVDNDDWRMAIFDATSTLTFADVDSPTLPRGSLDLTTGLVAELVGESAGGWGVATGGGGVNNQEVIALIGDPDDPTEGTASALASYYEDVDWSSFGSPNVYNPRPGTIAAGGEDDNNLNGVQDFSGLRGGVLANTYDFAAAGTASFNDAGSWELADDNSAAPTSPAAAWTARVLNSGAADVTAVVVSDETVTFVEAGATGAGDAVIEIEGGETLTATGRAIVDDGGVVKIELDGDVDGQGKLEAGANIDLFAGSAIDFEFVGEASQDDLIKAGTYTLVESTGGDLQGTFTTETDLGVYDDAVGVTYTSDSVLLTLDFDLLSGDANLDGVVGSADFSVVSANFGGSGGWTDGDFNGDGVIGSADFSVVASNFGSSLGLPSVAVPEPSAGLLASLAASALFARARRTR